MTALPVIDSHVHLWDPARLDYPWLAGTRLDRPFDGGDLRHAAGEELAGFVVVQADCAPDQGLAEVHWVTAQMTDHPHEWGIVAFAPVELGRQVTPLLHRLVDMPQVLGVRRLLQDERPGFALEPDFLTGLELLADLGLPFDVCVRAEQLPDVIELVRRVPATNFVLDHLGKPTVGRPDDGWSDNLSSLASYPNVVCKLSGLSTETRDGPWSPDVVRPYLAHALAVFGPTRCLFGSDWPVLTTAATHEQWLDAVRDAVLDAVHDSARAFTGIEVEQVMSGNARSHYRRLGHRDAKEIC